MAAITIGIGGNSDSQVTGQTYFFFAPLFLPLLILGVPLLDTGWAILRRARNRTGVSVADKGHLHHRLMNLGHGQRRSVRHPVAWTALLSAVVLYPTYTERGDALIPAGRGGAGRRCSTRSSPRGSGVTGSTGNRRANTP